MFNKAPYKNVIVLGHVQDENGQKMSKSKGNAVDPFDALETYGADAIRWYFYTTVHHGCRTVSTAKLLQEGQRKFMGTCGILMHSLYCMRTLTSLMQQNIH